MKTTRTFLIRFRFRISDRLLTKLRKAQPGYERESPQPGKQMYASLLFKNFVEVNFTVLLEGDSQFHNGTVLAPL